MAKWSGSRGGSFGEVSNIIAATEGNRLPFIQKVYGVFLAGILSAVAASAGLLHTSLVQVPTGDGGTLAVPSGVLWGADNYLLLLLGFFALFFIAGWTRRMPALQLPAMLGFAAMTGLMITPELWMRTLDSPGTVPMAGSLTVLIFGSLTAYAWLSRQSFSFLGAGLFVALLGLIAASVLNMLFFHSSWGHLMLAWGALVIFSGYVLFDTHRIMERLPEDAYVLGALELFLDFVNIFLALLRILGGSRR